MLTHPHALSAICCRLSRPDTKVSSCSTAAGVAWCPEFTFKVEQGEECIYTMCFEGFSGDVVVATPQCHLVKVLNRVAFFDSDATDTADFSDVAMEVRPRPVSPMRGRYPHVCAGTRLSAICAERLLWGVFAVQAHGRPVLRRLVLPVVRRLCGALFLSGSIFATHSAANQRM